MRVYSKFHLFDRPGPSHCFISRNQRSGRRGPSEGELIFGVKIEDTYCDEQADKIIAKSANATAAGFP